jgi:hypothetical protein
VVSPFGPSYSFKTAIYTEEASQLVNDTLTARPALGDGTTHVLHFGHYCGASRLERIRGKGLWVLMTAADYSSGREHSERDDWHRDAPKGTPVADLVSWVSARAGYPVTLTRADELIDPGWQSLVAYRVTRAHADPGTGSALPPIVVRDYRQEDVASWKQTEAELAPVLALMSQIGLTQAGFRLAAPREASINDRATITERGDLEKLTLARDAIREAARGNGTFWTLPNAMLYYKGLVTELYGDRGAGEPYEHTSQRMGGVRLVPVRMPAAGEICPAAR